MRDGKNSIIRLIRMVFVLLCWGLVFSNMGHLLLAAEEPLHEQIDRLVYGGSPNYEQLAAEISSDAEFLRRVSLDLSGVIPSADTTREFLANDDPRKRMKLIDRLLASPEYARHMQQVFDVMLMRRLPQKNVTTTEWETFLRMSFAENKPWDQMTREILAADGTDARQRGPARFYLDREGSVDQITRDIGRIFLGADLECAQCHDHPEIDDYKQEHYYGISSYLVRSFVFTDKKSKTSVFAEKAEGEVSFISVFADEEQKKKGNSTTLPKLFAVPAAAEPVFKKGDAYQVKPKKDVRPIPKFSRRMLLPESVTSPSNRRFARTSVNRMWEMMLGRGLVHPVYFDHQDNPPSHPELLDLLTDEFLAHGHDLKWLLKELALSKTYQRSSYVAEKAAKIPEKTFAQSILKPLSPSQLSRAVLEATGEAYIERAGLGNRLTEVTLHKRLVGHEKRFVDLFGGQPGNPPEGFQSTLNQVLFLSNDPALLGLLKPKPGNLADRLLKLTVANPDAIAAELYLSILNRPPTPNETREITEYLDGGTGPARTEAVGDLIWVLVTSSEFRLNH